MQPVAGRHLGEAAPAAADLEHPRARGQRERLEDAAVLGVLGVLQRARRVVAVERARVRHARIEPDLVERVAEVVVGVDVALRAAAAVAVEQVPDPVEQTAPPAAVERALDHVAVGEHHAHQRRERIGVPVAGNERLGESDVAAGQRRAEDVPVRQAHRGVRLAGAEEHRAAGRCHHRQATVAQPLEQREHRAGRRRHGLLDRLRAIVAHRLAVEQRAGCGVQHSAGLGARHPAR